MEDKEKVNEESDTENEPNWQKSYRLSAFDNLIPIVNSMITLLESEKNRTLQKLEETKNVLEKIKKERK
jgi:hypothetical protein